MSWIITPTQPIPAVIGEPFGGGYFAGYISHTADGNPTHALIVAPRATGATGTGYTLTTNLEWKTTATTTAGTTSEFDGAANTAAMVTAGTADHPSAQFCVGLSIGGFTDWYLPARAELDIAYFNLKPTTALNIGSTGGINAYSIPARPNLYSPGYPTQVSLALFTSGSEAFVDSRPWASNERNSTSGWFVDFEDGRSGSGALKTSPAAVRAFRRIAL